MTLPDIDTVLEWRGRTVVDRSGEKIGKFEEIYLDTETDRPEWVAVSTGLFGRRQSLVPLSEAQRAGDDIQVPFDKEHVQNAPSVDPDGELSQDDEARLYSHYDLDYSKHESQTGLPAGTIDEGPTRAGGERPAAAEAPSDLAPAGRDIAGTAAPDVSGSGRGDAGGGRRGEPVTGEGGEADRHAGAATDSGDAPEAAGGTDAAGGAPAPAEARSSSRVVEEVGTEVGRRERVRLKKYLVTEEVTKRVPVTREEVRVEREPLEGPEGRQAVESRKADE